MNTLTLALLSAFTALDTATVDEMRDAAKALRDLSDENQIDTWVTDPAIDAIEHEIEIRTANLLEDGEPIDCFNEVNAAIHDYRN